MKLIKVHELLFSNGVIITTPHLINPDQIVYIRPDNGIHRSGDLGSRAYICLIGHHAYIKESPEEIISLINQTQ